MSGLGGSQKNPACHNSTNSLSVLNGILVSGSEYYSSTENSATTADSLDSALDFSPIPKNMSAPKIYCVRAVTF